MVKGTTIITAKRESAKGAPEFRSKWNRWHTSAALLSVALVVEIYFLLHDFDFLSGGRSPASITAPPIAELISRANTVKSQMPGELIWEDTRDGQTLFRQQSILTLPKSKAEVAFLDGTGLVIDENSLIQLEKTPADGSGYQKIVVRLVRGTIHKSEPRKTPALLKRFAEKTPELEVQVGDARAILPAEAELTITATPESGSGTGATPEMAVQVHSGELKIESAQGSALTVKQGEQAVVSSAPNAAPPAAKKPPFALIGPRAGESIQDSQGLKFRWQNDPQVVGGNPLELEVSSDAEFQNDVKRVRIAGSEPPLKEVETFVQLPKSSQAKLWYWRVRSIGRTPASSAVEKFWIAPKQAPELKFPANGARIAQGQSVSLSWIPVEGANSYEIDLAGKTLNARDTVTSASVETEGKFSWRVRARFQDGTLSDWSETREIASFQPNQPTAQPQVEDLPPPPPSELQDAQIDAPPSEPNPQHSWLFRWLVADAVASENVAYSVHLKWRPVPGIQKYRVQIGRQRSFENILAETDTSSPEWTWTYRKGLENSKGRVFYRVASIGPTGRVGAFSEPKPIQIPESILAKKPFAPKAVEKPSSVASASKPEVYNSMEEEGSLNPADAATESNLATVAAQSPQAVSAPVSSVPATPVHEAPKGTVATVTAPDEGTLAPESLPVPPGAVLYGPESEPTQPLATQEKFYSTQLRGSIGVYLGYGGFSQTAGTTAPAVSADAFFTQRLVGSTDLQILTGEKTSSHWSAILTAGIAGYTASSTARPILQRPVNAYDLRLDILHWSYDSHVKPEGWNYGWGGAIDRQHFWARSGPQSVEPSYGISVGPALYAQFTRAKAEGILPNETGFGMSMPLSGILYGHFAGIDSINYAEWEVARLNGASISLRTELQFSLTRWGSESSSLSTWGAFVAPTLRFFERKPEKEE